MRHDADGSVRSAQASYPLPRTKTYQRSSTSGTAIMTVFHSPMARPVGRPVNSGTRNGESLPKVNRRSAAFDHEQRKPQCRWKPSVRPGTVPTESVAVTVPSYPPAMDRKRQNLRIAGRLAGRNATAQPFDLLRASICPSPEPIGPNSRSTALHISFA